MSERQEAPKPEGEELLEADANYVLQVLLDHDIYCLEAKRLPGAIRAYIDRLKAEKEAAEWKADHREEMFKQREQLIRDLQTALMKAEAEKEAAINSLKWVAACEQQYLTRALTAEQSLEAVRRETIEQCAKVCEARVGPDDSHNAAYNAEDMACAKAIRSLLLPGSDRG